MSQLREHWKTHYHITIDPSTNIDEFNAKAKKLGLKPTIISMLRNGYESKDLMFTVYQKGNDLDKMYQDVGRITLEGLKVIRVKMEEQFKNPEDTIGLDLSDGKYLEFHIKVFKSTTHRMIDNTIDVLLSSNPKEDKFDIISLRAYNPCDLEKIISYINKKKSFISELHSEQIVIDTNPNVDEGWIPLTESSLNPEMVCSGAVFGELLGCEESTTLLITKDINESLTILDSVQQLEEFDKKVWDKELDGNFEDYMTDDIAGYHPVYFFHPKVDTTEFRKIVGEFFKTGKLPCNWKKIDFDEVKTIKGWNSLQNGYKWYGAISKIMEISGSESPMEIKGNNGYLVELDSISDVKLFQDRVDYDLYEDVEDDWSTDHIEGYFIKAPTSMPKDEVVNAFDRFLVFEERHPKCEFLSDLEKVKEVW